ncbi:hypothetical protein MSG28_014753 [Choristoneura fumiferana]|uniref:Uncharacterized protein n=1 Tax=Choristoneura fumiferana TaxID=7141 RepID=A0ACC0JSL4_CHOFU|nr:hypothetical protein MSG28_014753 [Choristoneura fumiferana]
MGNKRKLEVITISSDDDEDNVPLKLLEKPSCSNTANGLKTYSVHQCEFCDEVFLNKYDMLIHNVKHIIIPLLKQSIHQCTECLFYFISKKDLKHHMKQKHNIKLKSIDKKTKTKHENEEMEDKLKLKDVRIDLVDIRCMKDDLVKAKVDKSEAISKLNDVTINLIDIKMNKDLIKTKEDSNKEVVESKIRSRLRFEDDIDNINVDASVGLLNDLTKECKVNMNLFDEPWVHTDNADVADPKAVTEVSVDTESETVYTVELSDDETEEFTPSTHFEELVQPGMYRCKRCQQIFGTRFQLIQHDMSHIKIRKSRPLLCEFCERFISTSRLQLKQHMLTHSPDLWNHKQRLHTTCNKCGLKYHSYTKHVENYHELVYCHLCYQGFDSDEERLDHIREHLIETKCMQCDLVSTAIEIKEHQRLCHKVSNVSTIKICETCSMFVKNNHNIQYVFLENISEIGTRLTCERCKKKFFELKLVRRLHKGSYKEREGGDKKKVLSNTERLKNIQQRLKLINKLSRF